MALGPTDDEMMLALRISDTFDAAQKSDDFSVFTETEDPDVVRILGVHDGIPFIDEAHRLVLGGDREHPEQSPG